MDQPSIDGVNTWFVSKATREIGLKVALSGLGGDEIFGGYPSFSDIPRSVKLFRGVAKIPGLGASLRRLGASMRLARRTPKALGVVEYGGSYPGAYLLRRGLLLPFELKTTLEPELLQDGLRRLDLLKRLSTSLQPDPGSAVGRVSALESSNYMRNQLLRDADWASMAHSIELRTPLVDSVLLSKLAPCIPHFHAAAAKKMLARAPATPLPDAIANRPKTGFGVPLGQWMQDGDEASASIASEKGLVSREWAKRVFARREAATDNALAAA
jgi:asparagine synthase (glutamine-hydrolysing)